MSFFTILLSFFLFIASAAVEASCCDGESKLPWKHINEVLTYHSCGCADDCWIAEVRNKKTGAVKVRLRSDCEKVFQKIGSHSEEKFTGNANPLFSIQKFDAISKVMYELSK